MIKYIITIIFVILIIYLGLKLFNINLLGMENFETLPTLNSSAFVHMYDNNGNKLNIALVSKPFGADSDYKLYLDNINKYIYIGITSYMEFPYIPSNPIDNYILENKTDRGSSNSYNLEMYFTICNAWLHCFRNPNEYLPIDRPLALISESDFVNYNVLKPDPMIEKQFDFIYSCPKVNEDSSCDDWVSHNKNWHLALKCLPILCLKYKLKGLLVGRKNCILPEGCNEYIETTGWVDYMDNIKLYNKCKFIFVPNLRDASPRVLTEALSCNLPCLVNYNILGGWKYVDSEKTGEFFTDENDIDKSIQKLLANMKKYNPRQYIIDNYGPINSGRKLKKFIFDNFAGKVQKLNLDDTLTTLATTDVDYIVFRGPLSGFIEEGKEKKENKEEITNVNNKVLNNLSVFKL